MQFQVPQFIEVEDKIFGPLTFKQFIYLCGGAGASYLLLRVLPIFLSVPLIIAIVAATVALGFMEYNGRPFVLAAESAFYFVIHPRLYLWNNEKKPVKANTPIVVEKGKDVYVPKLSNNKLHDLAWSLDIQERIAGGSETEDDRKTRDVMAPIITARQEVQ